MPTSKPRSARATATASPMPESDPVTMATLSYSSYRRGIPWAYPGAAVSRRVSEQRGEIDEDPVVADQAGGVAGEDSGRRDRDELAVQPAVLDVEFRDRVGPDLPAVDDLVPQPVDGGEESADGRG